MSSLRGLLAPWVVAGLVLAVLVAVGIELGVLADILSPSVWIDVVALWPIGAIGLIAAPIVWVAAGRQPRHLAIAGLSLFSWMAIGLALHLSGSEALPVAEAGIVAPSRSEVTAASLAVELDAGALSVSADAAELYRFSPIREGGTVGAPAVFEQTEEGRMTVVAVPRDDPGLYVFRGWDVGLGVGVTWDLDLAAPELTVDLGDLSTGSVVLEATSGSVVLGAPAAESTVELCGRFRVFVPEGVPIRLAGEGVVPDDWTLLDGGGARSPVEGAGWVISVESGSRAEIWYR